MNSLLTIPYHLVLGSSSPRRREMLTQLGIVFEVCKPDVIEKILPGESADEYVIRNCKEKAEWVFNQFSSAEPELMVISADTVVAKGEKVLEKPLSVDDAKEMLKLLSGSTHEVVSGFCINFQSRGKVQSVTHKETTIVHFSKLSQSDIDFYVATGEPMDKAGAYGIQGVGGFLVNRIEGSYSNVVGLPVQQLIISLRKILDSAS